MNRRRFLRRCAGALAASGTLLGCRGQHAHVLKDGHQDMVGSHCAGAETFKPLIDEALCKLLARHQDPVQQVSDKGPKRICFVGVENCSAEELCDFKEQMNEIIDTRIVESKVFQPISRHYVQVGLRHTRLRPDELFLPANQRNFRAVMEQQNQPFDYLLFAKLTSGTTRNNGDMQRDYLLTLELVDIHTGQPDKESATLRKGYHQSRLGKLLSY